MHGKLPGVQQCDDITVLYVLFDLISLLNRYNR